MIVQYNLHLELFFLVDANLLGYSDDGAVILSWWVLGAFLITVGIFVCRRCVRAIIVFLIFVTVVLIVTIARCCSMDQLATTWCNGA